MCKYCDMDWGERSTALKTTWGFAHAVFRTSLYNPRIEVTADTLIVIPVNNCPMCGEKLRVEDK